jgi:hypothetical protein
MKPMRTALIACMLMFAGNTFAQQTQQINLADSTGLPGDNFSLQGALAMFKESKSLDDFEKRINQKDNNVNNLDLNGDGKVDYVRVVADKKDDVHIVVLQVPVSKAELQDVAVIEIEKDGAESAYVQILGDEALYGETIVVEPKEDGEPSDPGVIKKGPAGYTYSYPRFYYNVWGWPCIGWMYAPVYVVYISPWYWNYWPGWWSPWYPYPWRYHYMSAWHYHHHYHYAPYHRSTYAHAIYTPRRSRSDVVYNRTRPVRDQYKATQAQTTRPRPGAVMSKPRPSQTIGKPGTRPNDQVRPGQPVRPSQPAGKPQTRPSREDQVRPVPQQQTRPQTKPQTRPQEQESRPQTKPQTRPQQQQMQDQESKPKEVRPQSKPQSRPQMQQSQGRPMQQPSKPMSSPNGGVSKGGGQSKSNQR